MWGLLSTFVNNVCKGRDASHGHEHMKTVAESALKIYENIQNPLKSNHTRDLVITTAWLHDVSDHKYTSDKNLDMIMYNFLKDFWDELDIKLILSVIDRISYSKENKILKEGKKLDWEEVLGEVGCFVRDIVSDADKLEAMGKIGIERCIEYAKYNHLIKTGKEISESGLIDQVITHADEKLLRLKDEFIRTDIGKRLAEPLHNEMKDILTDMKIKKS